MNTCLSNATAVREEKEEKEEKDVDLTSHEHERALMRA